MVGGNKEKGENVLGNKEKGEYVLGKKLRNGEEIIQRLAEASIRTTGNERSKPTTDGSDIKGQTGGKVMGPTDRFLSSKCSNVMAVLTDILKKKDSVKSTVKFETVNKTLIL